MAQSVASGAVIPIEAFLLALAIFVASGRLVPKIWQRQYPTLSDSFLIASILNTIALFITDFMTYKLGGMEEYDPTAPEPSISQAIALKKVTFAGNYFYDTGIYLPKLAILALYYRLLPNTMPWLRKALYTVTGFTAGAMVTTCFLDTFWCGADVSVNWSPEEGLCNTFASKEVFRTDWIMNIITDLLICILPFPILHKIQLGRRQIWGLAVTFSLGAITIAMSIARFATIEVVHAWTNVFVLSMAEMAVAIMVVSLPSMRSFLRRGGIFASRKTFGSSGSRGAKYGVQSSGAGSSNRFVISANKSRHQDPMDEDSGSEVELNTMSRKDVIYETRRVSVQFSNSAEQEAEFRKAVP